MSQDDELFGNDINDSESENNKEEVQDEHELNTSTKAGVDSDIDENDKYTSGDFFGDDNVEYKKASAFPMVKCPGEKIIDNYE